MLANSPSSSVAAHGPFDRDIPKPLHAVTERDPATTRSGVILFEEFRLVPSTRMAKPVHNLAARARLLLFAFMLRNAARAVDLFRIPTDNFIEMGRLVEI
jgi:K+ transporter